MRIGIFGGTFDPIHNGHLILAEQCRASTPLDEIWFLPSFHPPHKADKVVVRFEQRCDMIELAIAGHPSFRVERIEKDLPAPSFTVQTLTQLKRRHPEHELFLLLGADNLPELASWFEPKQILTLAELVVVPRPGSATWTSRQLAEALGIDSSEVRMHIVESPLIGISSREIRRAIEQGSSIRYLVPRAVEEYIRERKLYALQAKNP